MTWGWKSSAATAHTCAAHRWLDSLGDWIQAAGIPGMLQPGWWEEESCWWGSYEASARGSRCCGGGGQQQRVFCGHCGV